MSALYAWSGVGAFAASLAYFSWFYFVGLDRMPARELASAPILRNTVLFALFALHHSVLARESAKRRLAKLLPADLERPTYIWIASTLFFVVCFWWTPLPWRPLYAHDGMLGWLHRLVQLSGLLLMARSARRLDLKAFVGVSVSTRRSASVAEPAVPSGLRVAGPYHWLRHPLYLGLLLVLYGTPRLTADRLVFSTLALLYILIAIPWEERGMERTFGPEYEGYRSRVRWRLIPGVY